MALVTIKMSQANKDQLGLTRWLTIVSVCQIVVHDRFNVEVADVVVEHEGGWRSSNAPTMELVIQYSDEDLKNPPAYQSTMSLDEMLRHKVGRLRLKQHGWWKSTAVRTQLIKDGHYVREEYTE